MVNFANTKLSDKVLNMEEEVDNVEEVKEAEESPEEPGDVPAEDPVEDPEEAPEEDEPEELHSLQTKPLQVLNLLEIKSLLRCEAAIARTALPGKHREMDMQMKNFAALFEHELASEVRFPAATRQWNHLAGASVYQEHAI